MRGREETCKGVFSGCGFLLGKSLYWLLMNLLYWRFIGVWLYKSRRLEGILPYRILWLKPFKYISFRLNSHNFRFLHIFLTLWNLLSRGMGLRYGVCRLPLTGRSPLKHIQKVKLPFPLRLLARSKTSKHLLLRIHPSFLNCFQVIKLLQIFFSMLFNLREQGSNGRYELVELGF